MIPLSITPDLDRAPWTDIDKTQILTEEMATVERVGLLRHGTVGGRATIALLIRLPDGRCVAAETTLRLAVTAARAIAATPAYAEEDLP